MRRSAQQSFARDWLMRATLAACVLFHTGALAAPPAAEPITVAVVQGDVRVTMNGATQALKAGMVVTPPAEVRTGRDGFVELRQARTRMSVAADSQLGIPVSSSRGALIERVLQARGNVYYDVAPRSGSKLKVETAYLVASIKGTQFNVAASADSATVSLFEGRLEVWTSDGSDVVQLDAGEIATRGDADEAIRVLMMNSGELLRAGIAPASSGLPHSTASGSETPQAEPPTPLLADSRGPAQTTPPAGGSAIPDPVLTADVVIRTPVLVEPTPVIAQPDVTAVGAPPLVLDVAVPSPVNIGLEIDPAQAPLVDPPAGPRRPESIDLPISPPPLELNLGPGLPLPAPGLEITPQVAPVGKGRPGL